MKVIAHEDPAIEPFKEKISNYAELARMLGLPYWVFITDANPVGLVTVGKEPVQLLAPIGTLISIIDVIDFEQPKEVLNEFASRALALSKEKGVTLTSTSFPAKYEELGNQFENLGFEELANSYRMACALEEPIEGSSMLQFDKVPREAVNQFIEYAIECMSDSPDVVLNMILKNLQCVSDELLDIWYNLEQLYIVSSDGKVVGILDLNLKDGVLANIGVAPRHRGKGIGRQIMLFGLKKLKDTGVDKARLRVNVKNKRAIHLYETLGFTVADQYRMFIWRK